MEKWGTNLSSSRRGSKEVNSDIGAGGNEKTRKRGETSEERESFQGKCGWGGMNVSPLPRDSNSEESRAVVDARVTRWSDSPETGAREEPQEDDGAGSSDSAWSGSLPAKVREPPSACGFAMAKKPEGRRGGAKTIDILCWPKTPFVLSEGKERKKLRAERHRE